MGVLKKLNFLKTIIIIFLGIGLISGVFSGLLAESTQIDTIPSASFDLSSPNVYEKAGTSGVIDSDGHNIFYWLQLSDIHMNMEENERLTEFENLCDDIQNVLQPAFVLSTGDNVDGKTEDEETSQHYQDINEYQYFNQTLSDYGFDRDFWFSGIGNHENYNTGYNRSLYYDYIRNETQYAVDFATSFGTYRFIMADTTQEYGLANSFCLWGDIQKEKMNHLESLFEYGDLEEINQTIVTGHHPLNTIMEEKSDDGNNFKDLIIQSGTSAYLCGHLHLDYVYGNTKEYAYLHCPSFKDKYEYRICAYDNDVFSFTDEASGDWPAVLITNPCDAPLYNDNLNLEGMLGETEIRTLIFDVEDPGNINAEVSIDGVNKGNLVHQGDNLWTYDWNPEDYNDGNYHNIKVSVSSPSGTNEKEIDFNLSNFEPLDFRGFWNLLIDFPVIPVLVGLTIALLVIGIFRMLYPVLYQKLKKIPDSDFDEAYINSNVKNPLNRFYLKRWMNTTKIPKWSYVLIMALLLYPFYGPLLLGELSAGTFGALWFYRLIIDGTYINVIYSWIYAPLLILCAVFIQDAVIIQYKKKKNLIMILRIILSYLILAGMGFFFMKYFGLMTLFINPFLYIFVLIPIILLYSAKSE